MTKNIQQRLIKIARDIETGEYSEDELKAQKEYKEAIKYRVKIQSMYSKTQSIYLEAEKEFKRVEKELDKAEDRYDAAAEALHHLFLSTSSVK